MSDGRATRVPLQQAITACFALGSMPLMAQESPSTSAPEQSLGVVKAVDDANDGNTTQIGKVPQSLRDIPQAMTVINREVLDAQSATRLTDALRNVPGITISAGEGGQIGDNINLRGFSARTDLFLDGFRDRGQYTRDTFFLESVEVLKGPSSILFGRGSTGGVINQTSKKPVLRDANEVAAAVGTDSYYRLTADVNAKLSDTSALRVVALGHQNKSTRDVIESNRYGINPSLRVGIGSDTEITASLLLQRNREIPDYGFPLLKFDGQLSKPVDAPESRYYGFTDDKFNQDVNSFNLTIQHRINETATLTNLSQYTTYHTVASPTPLGGLVNPTSGAPVSGSLPIGTPLNSLYVIRQQRDREINDSSLYNQTYLTLAIPGFITQTILAGVDIGRDQYHNDTFARTNTTYTAGNTANVYPIPAVNLGGSTYEAKPALSATVVRVRTQQTDATANSTGLYVNDQLDVTSQWKVVAGLRWDHYEVRQQQLAFNYFPTNAGPIAVTPTVALTSLQHSDNMFSERAGIIFQPDEKQSYYVSYGTSFNPSGEAVTLSANNANLDPEKNRSFEIGSKISAFNNSLLLTGAIFRVEKTNARTTDPTTASVQTLGGLVRVDGFEVGVTGKISDNWQVLAGYSFLDGKIVRSNDIGTGISLNIRAEGQVPQNTPRHNATVWTTYRFASVWEIGGGAVYASQRFVNNFGTAAIDGYVRGDMTVAYVQKKFDVRVNVLNLTDKVYFETASGGRATPATGRQVVARFAYRFD